MCTNPNRPTPFKVHAVAQKIRQASLDIPKTRVCHLNKYVMPSMIQPNQTPGSTFRDPDADNTPSTMTRLYLIYRIRLSIIIFIAITLTHIDLLLPSLLLHLSICTPAQHQKRRNDKQSSNNGSWTEWNASPRPIHNGN